MRYRLAGALILLLGLLWLLYETLHLDPVRTGLGLLLLYGGYWLLRSGAPGRRTTVAGVLHLMDREFQLDEIDLSCGIADVKIDLSRAIIPPGEHQIRIRGLVGNVDIYVPYDLELSAAASVRVGAVNVMNAGHTFETGAYGEAASKVKVAVSLVAGDVNVRYL